MTIHNLPKWNLTEIYESINDPKIDKDINKIKKLISIFEKKWKGKIKKLSAEEIVKCLKQYEKINEKAGIISTHSSLSFASNMQDSEISQYNAKIADFFSETFSKLVFVALEIASVNNKIFNEWFRAFNF